MNPVVPNESLLIATARSMRPHKAEDPAPSDTRTHGDSCPFCSGDDQRAPPIIAAYPAEENWQVRIVENLYPILGDDRPGSLLVFGLQRAIHGYGRHIDHPQYGIALHEMSVDHLVILFTAYRNRMQEFYGSDPRIRYVLVFKNFGPAAGASIAHTHSQIIAMPVVPETLYNELTHSRNYFEKHHQCILCSLIDEALTFQATIHDRDSGEIRLKINVGQYVVERGTRFIAVKPFASRYEWEVHILPLHHQSNFIDADEADRHDLARVLQRTMARLDTVIGGAQYNFFLHSLPRAEPFAGCAHSYHWHLEICPRTSIPTGFELASGLFVNTISPEDAAERLRAVSLGQTGR